MLLQFENLSTFAVIVLKRVFKKLLSESFFLWALLILAEGSHSCTASPINTCPTGKTEPDQLHRISDTVRQAKKGAQKRPSAPSPGGTEGGGPWRMAFLVATCWVSRPGGSGRGAGSHPWVPRDLAACPGCGHECDSLPGSIPSPPGVSRTMWPSGPSLPWDSPHFLGWDGWRLRLGAFWNLERSFASNQTSLERIASPFSIHFRETLVFFRKLSQDIEHKS